LKRSVNVPYCYHSAVPKLVCFLWPFGVAMVVVRVHMERERERERERIIAMVGGE
jgi:hypothetical protein